MDETTTITEPVTSTADDEERPILFLHQITRRFRQGDATLDILKGAELAVWAGQSVALVRLRAPANRRCCTSPVSSRIPTEAKSISTRSPPRT